jgi:hypothetical protein
MSIFVLLLYSGYAVGKVAVRLRPRYRRAQTASAIPQANSTAPIAERITLCTARLPTRRTTAITKTPTALTPVSRVRHPPLTLSLLVDADTSDHRMPGSSRCHRLPG